LATVIRLARRGRTHKAFYRVTVADSKYKPEGKFLEQVGTYDPHQNPPVVKLNEKSIINWLQKGATASATMHSILLRNGVMEKYQQVKAGKSYEEATGNVKDWKESKPTPNKKALAKVKAEEEKKSAPATTEAAADTTKETKTAEAAAPEASAEASTTEQAPAEAAPAQAAPEKTEAVEEAPQGTKKKSKKIAEEKTEAAPDKEVKAEAAAEEAPQGTKKKSKKISEEKTEAVPDKELKAEAAVEEAPKGTKKKSKKIDET